MTIGTDSNELEDRALAVYTGGALGSLTPVTANVQSADTVVFTAEAGREYRIELDGLAPPGGTPWMGSFHLNLNMNIPPGPRPAATTPAAAPSSPQTAPKAHRAPAKGPKKHLKKRCVVHRKRHKGCLARASFVARGKHRRHHAAG